MKRIVVTCLLLATLASYAQNQNLLVNPQLVNEDQIIKIIYASVVITLGVKRLKELYVSWVQLLFHLTINGEILKMKGYLV